MDAEQLHHDLISAEANVQLLIDDIYKYDIDGEPYLPLPAPVVSSEPVAWMNSFGDVSFDANYGKRNDLQPLYTHPARTLSDEEILEIYGEKADSVTNKYVIEFARAVLLKANHTDGQCLEAIRGLKK